MKTIISALSLFITLAVNAQDYVTSLYGFRLEQYREVTHNELGKPYDHDKHEDGVEFEVFVLNTDSSLYMVFEYLPQDPEGIFTIQLSGTDAAADTRFKGLHFGDSSDKVQKVLGKPTKIEDIGEYGQQWSYENANYSIEINTEDKLSSIKIKNTFPNDKDAMSKLPDFKKDILPKLTSGKNGAIAALLAADVEVTSREKLFYFDRSFDTEIKEDKGKVYAVIKLEAIGLEKIDASKSDKYEENMRVSVGNDPLHVIKINDEHTNIKEIVFKYVNSKWLIWEIKA